MRTAEKCRSGGLVGGGRACGAPGLPRTSETCVCDTPSGRWPVPSPPPGAHAGQQRAHPPEPHHEAGVRDQPPADGHPGHRLQGRHPLHQPCGPRVEPVSRLWSSRSGPWPGEPRPAAFPRGTCVCALPRGRCWYRRGCRRGEGVGAGSCLGPPSPLQWEVGPSAGTEVTRQGQGLRGTLAQWPLQGRDRSCPAPRDWATPETRHHRAAFPGSSGHHTCVGVPWPP